MAEYRALRREAMQQSPLTTEGLGRSCGCFKRGHAGQRSGSECPSSVSEECAGHCL